MALDFSKYYKSISVTDSKTHRIGSIPVGNLIAKEYTNRSGFYGWLLFGIKAVDPVTGKEFRKGCHYSPSQFRPRTLQDIEVLEEYLQTLDGKIKKSKTAGTHPWVGATEDIIAAAIIRQMLKAFYYDEYIIKSHEFQQLYGKNSPEWNRAIKPYTDYFSIDRMPKGLCNRPL